MSDDVTWEYVTWDYTEQLIIDRESENIEHIQRIGSGCNITRKCQVEEGVSSLLDDLDADSLFENIEGNPPDVVDNPNETKDCTITMDFKKKPQIVIKGSFDKNGLPNDWPKFAGDIFNLSDKGLHYVVLPFMERNGYRDGAGWWIKLQE